MDKKKNILKVSVALALLCLSVVTRSFFPQLDVVRSSNSVGDYSSEMISSIDFAHPLNLICEDVCSDDYYTVHRHQTLRDRTPVLLFSGNKSFDSLLSFSKTFVFFSSDTSPPVA